MNERTPTPGTPPSLGPGEIHVWAVGLRRPAAELEGLRGILSPDERERADRFRFEVHRHRFTVGRGELRRILAAYTGTPAAELEFSYGAKGKPELPSHSRLHFNLSHSEDLALAALTLAGPVGVDVERIKSMDDLMSIARRFFSPGEHARLSALPRELWEAGFFNCWTRKEAYVKAVGEGLSLPLDRFDVSLVPGDAARFLEFRDESESLDSWRLFDLAPAPGFAGAVALKGEAAAPVCRRWDRCAQEGPNAPESISPRSSL